MQRERRQGARHAARAAWRGHLFELVRVHGIREFDGRVVRASVPVKFLKNWIQSHYSDDLLQCCAAEFTGVERVDVALRQPGFANGRPPETPRALRRRATRRRHGTEPMATEARRVQVQPGTGR